MLVNVSRRAIRWVLVSAASLAVVIPSSARADEAARCSDAADKGQELRDAHRLVEARELLRVCAQSLCPLVIQKECSKWLEGVESSLPTVVVSARDARGAQVVNVTVTVDGRPFAALLDGQARPIDPGVHTFHFERQGQSVEQQVAVREGERNQSITVVLDAPGGGAPPAALASLEPQEQRAIPWKATGWAVGAVGIVGLGVGTVFGLLATSEKNRAHCDSGGFCDADPLAAARRYATASTIALVAGGIFAAGGFAIVLFAPSGDQPRAGTVRVTPRAGTSAAGVTVEGLW